MVCGDEGRMILSRQDIDTIADQILLDFQSHFHGYGQFPRTDIDLLASAYLDLQVHYHTLSVDGNLLGVTAYDAVDVRVDQDRTLHLERDTVLLERQFLDRRGTPKQWDSLARRRAFTLAHECSHQIIFRMETAAVKDELRKRYSGCHRYDCRELKNHEDWNEWQADTLGAALLMPRMYIQKYFVEYQQNQPLVSYGGAYAARERLAITHLMSFFGVSKSALEIRLKGLGYLKILPRYLYHDPWNINE